MTDIYPSKSAVEHGVNGGGLRTGLAKHKASVMGAEEGQLNWLLGAG